jgi:hypothetical protein
MTVDKVHDDARPISVEYHAVHGRCGRAGFVRDSGLTRLALGDLVVPPSAK